MHHESEQARRQILEALSTKWVENAAGVSRDTVAAWRRGRKPRADQWERFATALNEWRDGLPDSKEALPPPWAEGLEQRLTEVLLTNRRIFVQTMEDQLRGPAQFGVEQELGPPPPDEAAPGTPAAPPGREVRL